MLLEMHRALVEVLATAAAAVEEAVAVAVAEATPAAAVEAADAPRVGLVSRVTAAMAKDAMIVKTVVGTGKGTGKDTGTGTSNSTGTNARMPPALGAGLRKGVGCTATAMVGVTMATAVVALQAQPA